jgi:hypothetical protein
MSIQNSLTWTPRNGRNIKIWQDSFLGNPPLMEDQSVYPLRFWLEHSNKFTLYDISIWDSSSYWLGWDLGGGSTPY